MKTGSTPFFHSLRDRSPAAISGLCNMWAGGQPISWAVGHFYEFSRQRLMQIRIINGEKFWKYTKPIFQLGLATKRPLTERKCIFLNCCLQMSKIVKTASTLCKYFIVFLLCGPVYCAALMFSLICSWTNGWINKWSTGDLRRHQAHYDVTVMCCASATEAVMENRS